MTLRVKIEHMQPGYDKSVEVETVMVDQKTGELIRYPEDQRKHYTTVIGPAKSGEPNPFNEWLYVHYAQALILREVPNVVTDTGNSGTQTTT